MKVLFITRPYIGLSRGGLSRQIQKTAEALKRIGIEILYYDPWQNQIPDVDICHFFSTNHMMWYHFNAARRYKKPIVFSPILGYREQPLWALGLKVWSAHHFPGLSYHLVLLKRMLVEADKVIALNYDEQLRLKKIFRVREHQLTIIPNGIDSNFQKGNPAIFQKKYKTKDFVLQVGGIDKNKNQLGAVKAMLNSPYKLVIIGDLKSAAKDYYRRCCEEMSDNVIFTGHIPYDDPLLTSAYAAARVFILPSFSEVMPLSLYEAAQSGCNVVVSKNVPVEPSIRQYVKFVEPGNYKDLREQIQKAYETPVPPQLKASVIKDFDWDAVSLKILNIYRQLLKK